MKQPAGYDGYTAFAYLDADENRASFDLATDVGRLPSYEAGLTEAQELRARELIAGSLVISLHDHPFRLPADLDQLAAYQATGRVALGYAGLRRSGLDAVFDNVGFPGWSWDRTITDLGMRLCDVAQQDFVTIARGTAELLRAREAGRVALVLGLEGSEVIGDELDRIDVLYGLGIRQLGIVYQQQNALGSGLQAAKDEGLTALGRRAVRRMNQLGIAIDISHAGDRTGLDVIEASEHPVLITHAGARGVWNTRRMKPDRVLVACAEAGGLIGLEAAPHTTLSAANPVHSIASVMDHFRYCVDLIGAEHVAFGPDTFFGDHVALHGQVAGTLNLAAFHAAGPPFTPVGYVDGLENPGECFPNIVRRLVGDGWSDAEIVKVIGANVLRVLDRIWGARR
ncbi:dipeptidase [Catenulispora rubra]|uniref:dipeptidase n=1 Tax=Catenulispora rubra TaxID=280293 RepID=UPI0018926E1A|nr:membrane dipeptidase [Catenulispora rubra]